MYGSDIVDVIVCAAANAFETNFVIFQNIRGKAVIIYTNCSKLATNRTIYLNFDYYPGNSQNNHYSAIIEDTGASLLDMREMSILMKLGMNLSILALQLLLVPLKITSTLSINNFRT